MPPIIGVKTGTFRVGKQIQNQFDFSVYQWHLLYLQKDLNKIFFFIDSYSVSEGKEMLCLKA